MKFAIVFAAVFAVALAAPQRPDKDAQVVSQTADISPDHRNYNFAHSSDNGISASEQGQLKESRSLEDNKPAFGYAVTGAFSYVGDDGVTYSVRYTADENGFRPEVSISKQIKFVLILTKRQKNGSASNTFRIIQ